MTYATLEEAWGPDFNKKKKTKRDKRQETLGRKIADEAIDSEIVIPKFADTRQRYESSPTADTFNGYDQFSNMYGSPYKGDTNTLNISSDDIIENNSRIEQNYRNNIRQDVPPPSQIPVKPPVKPPVKSPVKSLVGSHVDKVIQLTEGNYNKLVEGFGNQPDDQFNQLLLYIFTGIFYLFMLDLMYQLGKKSY